MESKPETWKSAFLLDYFMEKIIKQIWDGVVDATGPVDMEWSSYWLAYIGMRVSA